MRLAKRGPPVRGLERINGLGWSLGHHKKLFQKTCDLLPTQSVDHLQPLGQFPHCKPIGGQLTLIHNSGSFPHIDHYPPSSDRPLQNPGSVVSLCRRFGRARDGEAAWAKCALKYGWFLAGSWGSIILPRKLSLLNMNR